MKNKEDNEKLKTKLSGLLKNKYALIVLLVGLVLILLPFPSVLERESTGDNEQSVIYVPAFSISREEERLQLQLSKIEGVGRVSVLLSVKGSVSRELAECGEKTLVLSSGGGEKVVDLYFMHPQYLGAVIVCEGADSAQVRLQVTQAVSAFTGLGSDRITVLSMSRE